MFALGIHFNPSLIFTGKAGAYSSGAQIGPIKYFTAEILYRSKLECFLRCLLLFAGEGEGEGEG